LVLPTAAKIISFPRNGLGAVPGIFAILPADPLERFFAAGGGRSVRPWIAQVVEAVAGVAERAAPASKSDRVLEVRTSGAVADPGPRTRVGFGRQSPVGRVLQLVGSAPDPSRGPTRRS
jgi:hypothetical protein